MYQAGEDGPGPLHRAAVRLTSTLIPSQFVQCLQFCTPGKYSNYPGAAAGPRGINTTLNFQPICFDQPDIFQANSSLSAKLKYANLMCSRVGCCSQYKANPALSSVRLNCSAFNPDRCPARPGQTAVNHARHFVKRSQFNVIPGLFFIVRKCKAFWMLVQRTSLSPGAGGGRCYRWMDSIQLSKSLFVHLFLPSHSSYAIIMNTQL